MADKPILFSASMVRALLDGRKTQTRRVLKIKGYKGFFQFGVSDTKGYDWTFRRADHVWEDYEHDKMLGMLRIQSRDRLYVREHWKSDLIYDDLSPSQMGGEEPVHYCADGSEQTWGWPNQAAWGRFRQGMHMPRWASRLTLTVTDARVQRLQDIIEADAIDEGCRPFFDENDPHIHKGPNGTEHEMMPLKGPVDAFHKLWNSLHGPDAWDVNPWLVAYSFDVHRGNIDQMQDT